MAEHPKYKSKGGFYRLHMSPCTLLKAHYTNTALQDLLMVIYLTQLTKTQLQLHEKLTSVSVNQLKEYQKLLPE